MAHPDECVGGPSSGRRSPLDNLGALVDRVPEGWTRVLYQGRAYGLARTTRASGGAVSVFAAELGGADVVSANVYRTGHGDQLRACEMPDVKVMDFLRGWELDSQPAGTPHSDGPDIA